MCVVCVAFRLHVCQSRLECFTRDHTYDFCSAARHSRNSGNISTATATPGSSIVSPGGISGKVTVGRLLKRNRFARYEQRWARADKYTVIPNKNSAFRLSVRATVYCETVVLSWPSSLDSAKRTESDSFGAQCRYGFVYGKREMAIGCLTDKILRKMMARCVACGFRLEHDSNSGLLMVPVTTLSVDPQQQLPFATVSPCR
jgi:hypothetical protein